MATAIPANQASFGLAELAARVSGRIVPGASSGSDPVRGVVTDSRAIQPGQLYVALRGERHDGHAFLADVQARGAGAALVETPVDGLALSQIVVMDTRRALGQLARLHRTRWGGPLVAITGSAGKTTTKELTAAALRALGRSVLATTGNLNNDIGLPMTLFQLGAEHDLAVVEIGTNAPGEIAWLAEVALPQLGVVTTVSLAHTQRLGSIEGVADEKCALLRALPAEGVAIYGADSAVLRERTATFSATRRLGFGLLAGADLRLLQTTIGPDLSTRVEYTVGPAGAARSFELALGGVAAALDALAALGVVVGLYGEASLTAAEAGLRSVRPLPGRMRPRVGTSGALVIDDSYNANPASMSASLRTLAELARVRGGRAVAALADMAELGEHSPAEHERIGREVVALGLSDVFFCGRDMAHAARAAKDEIRQRRAKGPHVEHVDDPLASVSRLIRLLSARDALLVKGSRALGMERVVHALSPEEGDAL